MLAPADSEIKVATDDARSSLKTFRDQAERDFILVTLRRLSGNISKAAQELGVRRPYLHRRMAALGISKKDYFG